MHCAYCNNDLIECDCPDFVARIENLRGSPYLAIDWDDILARNAAFRRRKEEPGRVRLTEDYLDLEVGMGYPAGTILIRSPHSGQYMKEGTGLGGECVACYSLIKGISEPIAS